MDAPTGAAFKTLITSVHALVERRLKTMVSDWEATDKTEPKPTIQSVIEDLASGQQKASAASFTNLQRASMYPHVVALQGIVASGAFATTD